MVRVTQNKFRIEIYRRIEQGWELETCSDNDIVEFKSINYKNKIERIYENVISYIWSKFEHPALYFTAF